MTGSSAMRSIRVQSPPDFRSTPEGLRTPVNRRKTIEQGAATSVLLAASPLVDGISGRYFEDCQESPIVTARPDDYSGVAAYALNDDNAARLWDVGERLIPWLRS